MRSYWPRIEIEGVAQELRLTGTNTDMGLIGLQAYFSVSTNLLLYRCIYAVPKWR